MKLVFNIFFFSIVSISISFGQNQDIELKNPSFESIPTGGSDKGFFLPGWGDCAPYYFRNETPPDIHSFSSRFFQVNVAAQHGNTFVGMVTRASNETWEMISQRLNSDLFADKCYEFKIHLAKSDTYISGVDKDDATKKFNFNKPVKLRIWGSSVACKKTQLLAESDPVEHSKWMEYTFRFKPKKQYTYILFEAFYKTPVLIPYNGNLLLDNASNIIEIPCPSEEILAQVDIKAPLSFDRTVPQVITATVQKHTPENNKTITPDPILVVENPSVQKKIKILKELDKKTISPGQKIKIEKLYFEADSSNLKSNSHDVLDEIYAFLNENPTIIIEIGGHTNGVPGIDYCNYLSTARAKNIAKYLYKKGIPKYRIKYKGYGKSKPLASDKTHLGRKKNQRVEIKILRVG